MALRSRPPTPLDISEISPGRLRIGGWLHPLSRGGKRRGAGQAPGAWASAPSVGGDGIQPCRLYWRLPPSPPTGAPGAARLRRRTPSDAVRNFDGHRGRTAPAPPGAMIADRAVRPGDLAAKETILPELKQHLGQTGNYLQFTLSQLEAGIRSYIKAINLHGLAGISKVRDAILGRISDHGKPGDRAETAFGGKQSARPRRDIQGPGRHPGPDLGPREAGRQSGDGLRRQGAV